MAPQLYLKVYSVFCHYVLWIALTRADNSIKPSPSLEYQLPSSATVVIQNTSDALIRAESTGLFEGPASTPAMAATQTVTVVHQLPVTTPAATSPSSELSTHSVIVPSTPSTPYSITAPSPEPTTSPPRELRFVKIEITLDFKFIPEYFEKESKEYKDLEADISRALEQVYRTLEGFVRVEILAFREGSVICDFILIMRSDASTGQKELKGMLQEASNSGKFASYKITKIHVEESDKTDVKEKLFQWSLITIIVLACVSGVLLLTVILQAICLYKAKNKQSVPYNFVAGDKPGISLEFQPTKTPDFYGSKDHMK